MFSNDFKLKIIIIFLVNYFFNKYSLSRKRIGIIGLDHSFNVGNNLLKYAIFIKISELGHFPYIIGRKFKNNSISFIKNNVNMRLINNFSEIKENDYDILMVNSDQTWRKFDDYFYDIAFLKFAEKFQIPKFVYGASLGFEKWIFMKKDEEIAKYLLQNFTGISVREKSAILLIKKYLGFNAQFVLDPTFLIDKKYYLNLIKEFKSEIANQINNEEFIFVYFIKKSIYFASYLNYIKNELKKKIFYLKMNNKNQVKEFIFGISHCKGVITDSFHGTIFSIIFKKPFITFENRLKAESRFNSLNEIFNIKNRIFALNTTPPINLLNLPLSINKRNLISLKKQSIKYLKKNLNY